MKKYALSLFILLAAALTGHPAFAGDTHNHDHAAATEGAAQDEVKFEPEDLLQEQMKEMRAQMAKINQTKDPAKRQKLLKEHNKSMRTSIRILRNMVAGMNMQHSHTPGGGMMSGSMDGMECENHRKGGQAPGKASKTWVCPMHPDEAQDHPGTCRLCGMDLVDKAELDAPPPEQNAMPDGMECDHMKDGKPCDHMKDGKPCDHMKDGMPCDHMQGGAAYPMKGMPNAILMLMEQLIEHNEAAMAAKK